MACVWRPDAATGLGPAGPGIKFPGGGGLGVVGRCQGLIAAWLWQF